MQTKNNYILHLKDRYPGLKDQPLDSLIADNLISPFKIQLPQNILTQAQQIISTIFKMRQRPEYLQRYEFSFATQGLIDPGNKSIMMSYDFHIDSNGQLRLIEINTNAAFLILGYELYRQTQCPLPITDFSPEEIRANILSELELQGKKINQPKVAIIDEKPPEQRLYIEFLVYAELFRQWNWQTQIVDYREVFNHDNPDFIYNRFTDFYLEKSDSKIIKQEFLNRSVCLSPNPFEYFLLADKQRFIEWSLPDFFDHLGLDASENEVIRAALLRSYDVKSADKEAIWAKRKSLFFKPKREFGSKKAFKGASISRKIFDELCGEDCLAQEYVAAPEQVFETTEGPQSFKYDLRCYAYQGRLQMVIARLYQGQVTNLRTQSGGFACVEFT